MLKKNSADQGTNVLEFTGERYTPEIGGSIELEHLHRYLLARQLVEGKTVLDIACGEGYGSALLASTADRIIGVDIDGNSINHAQKRYCGSNIEFCVGSCTNIPLHDGSVDAVVSFETIEHHEEHEAMLREIRRVLKPNGALLISSPDKLECTDKTGHLNPHHVKELYRNEFVDLLQRHFKNFRMYGQRVLHASAIFCEEGNARLRNFNIANDREKGTIGVPHPLFHIAIASDGELPDIDSGLLEQPFEEIEEVKLQKMIADSREAQLIAECSALADQASKFAMIKARPLRSLMYFALRRVYRRCAYLQKLRYIFRRWCDAAKAKVNVLVGKYSKDNARFHEELVLRRFDQEACRTAVLAPEPAAWPELDVSIVTYNSSQWLDSFFSSLKEQGYPLDKLHLHIVDNGSKDDTAARIDAFLCQHGTAFAGTSFVVQENMGFGAGHDKALRAGKCAYCLVTNVDLEFLTDSLCKVVRLALADPAGRVGSWELRQYPYEHPKHYDPVTLETAWSSHACVLLRRTAYEKCGGYDHGIFMYAEDVELSYRLRSHGFVLKYVPFAAVMHYSYVDVARVKPVQYTGSVIGNLYVRMRYGHFCDKVVGIVLYLGCMLGPAPVRGAKFQLARGLWSLIPSLSMRCFRKGPAKAYYPFYAMDYEMRRDGAFVATRPLEFSGELAPRVSVLIRTYKGRGFLLEQAIRTVFNQTYTAIELVVSEDGGETQRALVDALAGQAPAGVNVRFFANPKQGRSATGNAALAVATAPFFLFLDDDDLMYADHVETLVRALLDHPECAVAYALGTEVLTEIDIPGGRYEEKSYRKMHALDQPWDYDVLLQRNFLVISSLVKRDLYLARGGLDTELELLEDWNLWLRYGYGNMFFFIPKTTLLFRTPASTKLAGERGQALLGAYDEAKSRAMSSVCIDGCK